MPSEKRARQRAARREKRAAELKRIKRRRTLRRGLWLLALVAGIVGVVLLISSGSSKKQSATSKSTTTTSTSTTFPPPSTTPLTTTAVKAACPTAHETERIVLFKTASKSSGPPRCISPTSVWDATFETSVGSFVVRMPAAQSYAAVNNFVFLARWNYYDGTFFHRVIEGFVVQGGDPSGTGSGGPHHFPGYSFTGNTPPKSCQAKKDCYPLGSLAMANTGSPTTNGSQFFVVTGSAGESLPPHYTLFGHVTKGMKVVDKIDSYGAPASSSTGTPKVRVYLLKVMVSKVKG